MFRIAQNLKGKATPFIQGRQKIKLKELLPYVNLCLAFVGIINIMISYQAYWSFIDYTMALMLVWSIVLGFAVLQVANSMKTLVESIDMREPTGKSIMSFVSSSLAYAFFLYLFVHRIYYLAGFISFEYLSIILFAFFTLVLLLLISLRRRCFEGIRSQHTKKKTIILIFLTACFIGSLAWGITIPTVYGPKIVVSTIPTEISYEGGHQVQDVETVEIYVKAVEGYAWNIEITATAPASFYIWIDGMLDATKEILSLEYDQVVSFPLEIQPSHLVSNGTYEIEIKWSYKSASGHTTKESTGIAVFVGKTPFLHAPLSWWFVAIVVVLSVVLTVLGLLRRTTL